MLLLVQGFDDVSVGPALVGFIVLCVLQQHFIHVSACVLEQLVRPVENDESDLTVAQYTQLIRLLHQAKLALCESDLNQGQGSTNGV